MYIQARKFRISAREQQVLDMICNEHSSSEIAEKLKISIGTFYTYRKNLLRNNGTSNSIGLLKYAIKEKLLRFENEQYTAA